MINEVLDKNSGAILFKKDKESLTIDELVEAVKELKKKNNQLDKRIKKLEESIKESS